MRGKKIVVGWIRGVQNWAFRYLTDELIRELSGQEHVINDEQRADVTFIVEVGQLKELKRCNISVLHLDGFRRIDDEGTDKGVRT